MPKRGESLPRQAPHHRGRRAARARSAHASARRRASIELDPFVRAAEQRKPLPRRRQSAPTHDGSGFTLFPPVGNGHSARDRRQARGIRRCLPLPVAGRALAGARHRRASVQGAVPRGVPGNDRPVGPCEPRTSSILGYSVSDPGLEPAGARRHAGNEAGSRHWPVSTQRLHPVLGVSPWPRGSSDPDVGRLRSGPWSQPLRLDASGVNLRITEPLRAHALHAHQHMTLESRAGSAYSRAGRRCIAFHLRQPKEET